MEVKKKQKKQSAKESSTRQDMRHLGVLIGRVDDNVKLIAEQYGDIKKDINSINKTLDYHTAILDAHTIILNSHTEMLDAHTATLDYHTEILDSHTATLDSNAEMIGKIMVNSTITKENIEFIKNSLKKKIDVEEFAALERRVTLLERR